PTTTIVCAAPEGCAAASTCPSSERPANPCRTFGRVRDFIRVPSPAARTMTAVGGESGTAGRHLSWTTHRSAMAGGLGLEPRLQGSKGLRAADYPIPHRRGHPISSPSAGGGLLATRA